MNKQKNDSNKIEIHEIGFDIWSAIFALYDDGETDIQLNSSAGNTVCNLDEIERNKLLNFLENLKIK